MYNNALQEALQKLNNMGGKPQKSLKEDSNGPDSREEAFKCIRKLCDDAALAVKDSDIRNAIDTVCSYGGSFIRTDLICLDGGSAPGHFALHIPNGDKQIVFLIKDEDNPKISSRWDVRSMGPSEIEFLETTRKNNDQLKFYHHEYQGIPARLSMDKKQEEGLKESKKINESKEEFLVIVEDEGGWIIDRPTFESEKEAREFAISINRNENENYTNCYATGPISISTKEETGIKTRAFGLPNFTVLKNLPLMVFLPAASSDGNEGKDICVLSENEEKNLENDIRQFNDEMKDKDEWDFDDPEVEIRRAREKWKQLYCNTKYLDPKVLPKIVVFFEKMQKKYGLNELDNETANK